LIDLSPWDEPFAHWLSRQTCLIAPPSTSFYDCAVLGKKVVSTELIVPSRKNHSNEHLDDFDPIFEFVPKPTSLEELLCLINNPSDNFNLSTGLKNLLYREIAYPDCSKSLDSVANIINQKIRTNRTIGLSMLNFFFLRDFISSKRYLKSKLIKEDQSSDFSLHPGRRKWIDKLTHSLANDGNIS